MTLPKWREASNKPCSAVEIADTGTFANPFKVVRGFHRRALSSGTGDRTGLI